MTRSGRRASAVIQTGTIHTVTGMLPGSPVTIQVSAVDARGAGPQVALSDKSRPDLVAPTPPGKLKLTSTARGVLTATWAPARDDDVVAGYSLRYTAPGRRPVTRPLRASARTLVLRGLASGKRYTVSVIATDASRRKSRPAARVITVR